MCQLIDGIVGARGGTVTAFVAHDKFNRTVSFFRSLNYISMDITFSKGVRTAADPDLAVTPNLAATNGLYLTGCSVRGAKDLRSESRAAEIEVLSKTGNFLFGANSGFA